MTSQEKDRFIYPRMGWCWHEAPLRGGSDGHGNCWVDYSCVHCGYKHNFLKGPLNLDLTTWEGFGKLWEAMFSRDDSYQFECFLLLVPPDGGSETVHQYVNPTRFRDAVYDYFQEVER